MSTISTQPLPIRGAISDSSGMVTKPWVEYFRSLQVIATAGIYVIANPAITAGTHTKITYDEKGLVTAGVDATTTDIPEGDNLYFTVARVEDVINVGGYLNEVSIATANGFSGTSDGLYPEETITLGTTVNGIMQGDGTIASAVTIGSGLTYASGTLSANISAVAPLTYTTGTISTSMATSRLMGRTSASTGVMEEIAVGDYLSLSTGTLSGTGEVNPANSTDSTMYLALLDSATGKQQLKSSTLATYNGTTGHITSKMILNAGGTAAGSSPMKFNAGALMTTPEVGAMQMRNDDGTNCLGMRMCNNSIFGDEVLYSYNEFISVSGQSGLAHTTNHPVFKNGAASPYNNNNDIPIYQKASNTLHEIDMWVFYNVNGSCTATFIFTSGVAPASSGWFTRVTHSPLAGATTGATGAINQAFVTCDLQANSAATTQTFTVACAGAGDYAANFKMFFISVGVGTGSLKTTLGVNSLRTLTINGNTRWKCRTVPANKGNVIA